MAIQKIRSGIPGLDILMDGGLVGNSSIVVIGPPGTGKTIFALQFLRRGLESGTEGVHITLNETRGQVIEEAISLGWKDIEKYVKSGKLVFMEAAGSDFLDFVENEFPELIANWDRATDARIVIDPLTPVIWSVEGKTKRRDMLTALFRLTRRIGTVLATVEEHSPSEMSSENETALPMYIADTVIRLSHGEPGTMKNRLLDIRKCRSSWHTRIPNPYSIVSGIGIAVHVQDEAMMKESVVPRDVLEFLKREMGDLSPEVQERIKDIVRQMNKEDIGIFDFRELALLILGEYK